MKSNILKTIFSLALAAGATVSLNSCKEEVFTSRGDLFQPRFALEESVEVKNNNDATCVWYEVNDAVSYTVELNTNNYFYEEGLYMLFDTKESYFQLTDLPYGTKFYVRVRSNAADPINSSRWAKCEFTTEVRPEYAQILNCISRSDIQDESVKISWMVDLSNPADSFSVKPAMDPLLPEITDYIPEESRVSGEMIVEGLTPSTLYNVNIYDTSKPRKYDKPYNTVTFRTTGPAPQTVEVGITDDLSAMLLAGNDDPDTPEGTVYSLPEGSTYIVTPFAMKKGFVVRGPETGTKPVIVINGNWAPYSGSYISVFGWENVEIRNSAINQYFFNSGVAYTIEQVNLINVKFVNITRAFWRHKDANKKVVKEFTIDNCWFDLCGNNGDYGGLYGFLALGSAGKGAVADYDQIDKLVIRNSTFSRCWNHSNNTGWQNFLAHNASYQPVDFTLENCTFYDYCINNRLIDLSSTEKSKVTIRNIIIASPCGELLALGSGSKNTFSNNFITTDYKLGGSAIKATNLGVSAADLFRDPENGDYTIVDKSSQAYQMQAGDPRWLQ